MSAYRKRSKNIQESLRLLYTDMMDVRHDMSEEGFLRELQDVVYDQEQAVAEFKRQIVIDEGEESAWAGGTA